MKNRIWKLKVNNETIETYNESTMTEDQIKNDSLIEAGMRMHEGITRKDVILHGFDFLSNEPCEFEYTGGDGDQRWSQIF